jgi:adenylate kinase family enzyme
MQRIIVLGPPGSGKSTLARRLGAARGLPVFHLDRLYWQPGWIETPAEAFAAEVERIAALPAWVIDGNYTHTIAPRLQTADTLIYLDVPSALSLLRVIRRTLAQYGRVRGDGPSGCPEQFDLSFLHFVWTWNRERRVRTLKMAAGFSGRTVVARNRADLRLLLAER